MRHKLVHKNTPLYRAYIPCYSISSYIMYQHLFEQWSRLHKISIESDGWLCSIGNVVGMAIIFASTKRISTGVGCVLLTKSSSSMLKRSACTPAYYNSRIYTTKYSFCLSFSLCFTCKFAAAFLVCIKTFQHPLYRCPIIYVARYLHAYTSREHNSYGCFIHTS